MQRVSFALPQSSWEQLRERATRDQISHSEGARRAIWTYAYLRNRQDEGAEIVVRRPDGVEEVMILQVGTTPLPTEAGIPEAP